jgi:hypothetical protein
MRITIRMFSNIYPPVNLSVCPIGFGGIREALSFFGGIVVLEAPVMAGLRSSQGITKQQTHQ